MAVSNLQAPFFFQIFSKHTCKKRASGRFSNEKSKIRPKRYYFSYCLYSSLFFQQPSSFHK